MFDIFNAMDKVFKDEKVNPVIANPSIDTESNKDDVAVSSNDGKPSVEDTIALLKEENAKLQSQLKEKENKDNDNQSDL